MRKLILQMQMSVDGYVGASRPEGAWQVWDWSDNWTWDDDLKQDFNAVFAAADCLLLSRKMLQEGFLDHWGTIAKRFAGVPQYAFARKIIDIEKVVPTRTLVTSSWHRTTLLHGELVEQVQALKRQRGKDILCFGGAGLASSLIAAGLVDEFQLFVNPSTLGEGRSIFAGRQTGLRLELTRSRAYGCGIVVNRYIQAPVRLTRSLNASAENVFDAWLKPELIRQWLFHSAGSELATVQVEARPGGKFSIVENAGGELVEHHGEYLEIERPQRLVFTLEVPKRFAGVTRVAVHIVRATRGCSLTLSQTGVDKQLTEAPWHGMLDALAHVGEEPTRR
jgi:dihydrofolate reductase/uncharacterized protein YndB with AHSA1/START domain